MTAVRKQIRAWTGTCTPREPAVAARWLSVALIAAACVVVFMILTVDGPLAVALCVLSAALCVTPSVAIWRGWLPGARSWAVVLLATLAMLVTVDVATHDASITGMVFFLLPPVVAAGTLRQGAAWATVALSSAAALATTWLLLPPGEALATWAGVSLVVAFTVLLITRAVGANEALLQAVARQASVDPLTGLVTRRVFDTTLAAALAPGGRDRSALAVVDLDRFKAVNDSFGHPAGDQALVHVAAILVSVAGDDAVVSRLGGDELAVFVPGHDVHEIACRVELAAERVRRVPLVLPDGRRVPLSLSIGVAGSPEDGDGVEELYRAADVALYEAKRAGRDRVVFSSGRAGPAAGGEPGTGLSGARAAARG